MNERLLLLYQQSHLPGVRLDPTNNMPLATIHFSADRFAELIIKECVESIKVWRDATDEHMNEEEYYKGYRGGCDDSIVEIQTRFGVEL